MDTMTARAEAFARGAHARQVDKAGLPYSGHLLRVAARAYAHAEARGLSVDVARLCAQVGWLHDTIEDTFTEPDDLAAAGFEPRVIQAVEQLTRPAALPYLDWIQQLVADGDVLALIVKLADNEDNADPARQAVRPVSTALLDRYERSADLLRRALAEAIP